ncbi:MAG: NAD-binding protein, partial [Gammaproteobacteria bacterium]
QISEFSLIFVAMGVSLGHVSAQALGLVTLVGLVTIAASTYMITYSHELYRLCEPLLGVFERRGTPREAGDDDGLGRGAYPVIVFGLGRFGTAIGLRLMRRGVSVLGVDFNPLAVRRWRELGLAAEYGDATDAEFVAELPVARAEWIVVTIPIHPTGLSHEDTRATLIQLTRSAGYRGRIAVTSLTARDTEELVAAGADTVLEPFQDAADRAVELLGGAPAEDRTEVPAIEGEERSPP